MINHFRRWLNNLSIQDPVDRQMAALLQVVLLGFMSIIILAGIINMLIPGASLSTQTILVQSLLSLVIIDIPLFLLRRGFLRSSVFVIIIVLLAAEIFAIFSTNLRQVAETLTFLR